MDGNDVNIVLYEIFKKPSNLCVASGCCPEEGQGSWLSALEGSVACFLVLFTAHRLSTLYLPYPNSSELSQESGGYCIGLAAFQVWVSHVRGKLSPSSTEELSQKSTW